jgi:hypothetical protein
VCVYDSLHRINQRIQQVALQALATRGWVGHLAGREDSAVKMFDTSVGPKNVSVLVHERKGDREVGPSLGLLGQYDSEGHNVLSAIWFGVPMTADDDAVHGAVGAWVKTAEAHIDESYARRLFLRDTQTVVAS